MKETIARRLVKPDLSQLFLEIFHIISSNILTIKRYYIVN